MRPVSSVHRGRGALLCGAGAGAITREEAVTDEEAVIDKGGGGQR